MSRYAVDWEAELRGANALREAGRRALALQVYRHFFTTYPTNVYADDARYFAAELLVEAGERQQAIKLFTAVAADQESNRKEMAAERLAELAPP